MGDLLFSFHQPSGCILLRTFGNQLRIWDAGSGFCVADITCRSLTNVTLTALALTKAPSLSRTTTSERFLAIVGTADSRVLVIDALAGALEKEYKVPAPPTTLVSMPGCVYVGSAAGSHLLALADGALTNGPATAVSAAAAAGSSVLAGGVPTRLLDAGLAPQTSLPPTLAGAPTVVAADARGRVLAVAAGRHVFVFDASNTRTRVALSAPSDVLSLAVTVSGGATLVVAGLGAAGAAVWRFTSIDGATHAPAAVLSVPATDADAVKGVAHAGGRAFVLVRGAAVPVFEPLDATTATTCTLSPAQTGFEVAETGATRLRKSIMGRVAHENNMYAEPAPAAAPVATDLTELSVSEVGGGTLAMMITQALSGKDFGMVSQALSSTRRQAVAATAAALTPAAACALLEHVCEGLDRAPRRLPMYARWVRAVLVAHGTAIAETPQSAQTLQHLRAVLAARATALPDLARLNGRLNGLRARDLRTVSQTPLQEVVDDSDDDDEGESGSEGEVEVDYTSEESSD